MLRRLNDLAIFDPGRWPAREALARIVGSLGVAAFLVRRILQLEAWPGYIRDVEGARPFFAALTWVPSFLRSVPFDLERYYAYRGYLRDEIRVLWLLEALVWLAETGIFLGYLLAFLTRAKAKSVAKGFGETAFPFLMAGLPFLIVLTPYTYANWMPEARHDHLKGLYAINLVLLAGGALNVVALVTLRKAFSIMSEARVFVHTGVYGLIRHPLYTAHFGVYFCYTLLHLGALTGVLYVLFVAGQVLRARIEERKLAAAFPDYEEYRRRTGMFFPRLGGPERAASGPAGGEP